MSGEVREPQPEVAARGILQGQAIPSIAMLKADRQKEEAVKAKRLK